MKARNALVAVALAAAFGWAAPAFAHCDTLDGPVVGAAHKALETGKVEYALIWVQKDDDRAIRDAFAKARKARSAGGAAAEKADHAFYATLVRVHRKGEGAGFTGLKPAGTIEPPVVAADKALASGRFADVEAPIAERTRSALKQSFDEVVAHREFDPSDVAAGRAYVGAYVRYVHLAEGMWNAAQPADAHAHEAHAAAKSHADHAAPKAKAAHAH